MSRWLRTGPLPGSVPPIVSSVLFGTFAAGLTGFALMSITFGVTNGAGSLLSDGVVAGVAFALSGWWLVRSVRGDASAT